MTLADLSYPVITISGRTMVALPGPTEVAQGTRKAIRNGYFRTVRIVDSTGQHLRVSGARPQGLCNPFKLLAWLIGLPQALEFDRLELLSPVDLNQLKSQLSHQVDRDRALWGEVAIGANGLKARIQSASSFQEAITLFL